MEDVWRRWADERIRKHNTDLYEGNGKPAMTIRLDRVERFMGNVSKMFTAILLLLLGAIFTAVVDIIAHKV